MSAGRSDPGIALDAWVTREQDGADTADSPRRLPLPTFLSLLHNPVVTKGGSESADDRSVRHGN